MKEGEQALHQLCVNCGSAVSERAKEGKQALGQLCVNCRSAVIIAYYLIT